MPHAPKLDPFFGLVDFTRSYPSAEELMRVSIALALASLKQGGGPFGAVIANCHNQIVAAGCNTVIAACDATAHAETNCLREAHKKFSVTDLGKAPGAPFSLFTSAAPCIQCFGSIYWSGISTVYAAARKEDVEAIGFDEGPVSEALWQEARNRKGVIYVADFCRDASAIEPLETYRAQGGRIY